MDLRGITISISSGFARIVFVCMSSYAPARRYSWSCVKLSDLVGSHSARMRHKEFETHLDSGRRAAEAYGCTRSNHKGGHDFRLLSPHFNTRRRSN